MPTHNEQVTTVPLFPAISQNPRVRAAIDTDVSEFESEALIRLQTALAEAQTVEQELAAISAYRQEMLLAVDPVYLQETGILGLSTIRALEAAKLRLPLLPLEA